MEWVIVNGNEPPEFSSLPEEIPGLWRVEIRMKHAPVNTDVISFLRDGSPRLEIKTDACELICSFQFDAKSTPLHLKAPLSYFQADAENTLVLCNQSSKLSLHFNGLLVDEEWPLGACLLAKTSIQVNDDIVAYARILDLLGSEDSQSDANQPEPLIGPLQYWKPTAYGTRVGDCMPFYLDGRYHLYYLVDRHGGASKWGLGAHQWAHLSTTDFMTWDVHPMAVPITEQWEGSNCTGSVFYDNGAWYAFYAIRMSDYSPARLTSAVSVDGIHFTKTGKYFSLTEPYEPVSARDPKVFKDPAGVYHLLVTTNLTHPLHPGRNGCLAHLISTDLDQWRQEEPFIVTGGSDQPECSDYFYWNGWYYLIFSNYGTAKVHKSRSPFGPWQKPAADILDGLAYRVPKMAFAPDGRMIAAGFLALHPDEYAGCVIFRELFQRENGDLSTRFLEEVMPGVGATTALGDRSVHGERGYASSDCPLYLLNFRLTFEVHPHTPSMYYGLTLENSSATEGWDLRFEPDDQKAGFHRMGSPFIKQDENASLYNVAGLTNLVKVDMFINANIVDVMVNGERTMVFRMDRPEKGYSTLNFFAMAGTAEFTNICISPLLKEIAGT